MRILIADDDATSRLMLETTLRRWGHEVLSCGDGLTAWEILGQEGAPRLAVLDWMMPGMDGLEICRGLRKRRREPYVYVVLLTGKTQGRDLVAGLDAGADDYVTKPFNRQELRVRLRAGQRIVDLQDELIAAREALRHQATHDALTGLLSHAAILEALDHELARAEREHSPFSILMADLDHFKAINDAFGHQAGDAVLREAAGRFAASVRPYDPVGRYGGEEFLCVLPGCGSQEAAAVAERVRHAVAAEATVHEGETVHATMSIGVASWREGEPAATLLQAADAALYEAKAAGRDHVVEASATAAALK